MVKHLKIILLTLMLVYFTIRERRFLQKILGHHMTMLLITWLSPLPRFSSVTATFNFRKLLRNFKFPESLSSNCLAHNYFRTYLEFRKSNLMRGHFSTLFTGIREYFLPIIIITQLQFTAKSYKQLAVHQRVTFIYKTCLKISINETAKCYAKMKENY